MTDTTASGFPTTSRAPSSRELPPLEPTLLGALWRYRALAAAIVFVLVVASLAFSLFRPKVYEASASLLVEHPKNDELLERGVQLSNQQRYVADQVVFLQSIKVAERAAEIAHTMPGGAILTVGDIYSGLEVSHNNQNNDVVEITFQAEDAQAAAAGANALVSAYGEVRVSEAKARTAGTAAELDAQIKAVDEERAEVLQRLDAARAANLAPDGLLFELSKLIERRSELSSRRDKLATDNLQESAGVVLTTPAVAPSKPLSSHVLRNAVLAALAGLVLASLLSYFLALRRREFTARREPEEVLAAPLLSDVPNFAEEGIDSSLPVLTHPTSASAEGFRFVASSMSIQREGAGPISVVVTSALAGEGKSTVAANTALALAQSGARVLAIDADLTRRELTSRLLGRRHDGPGLIDVVEGRTPLEAAVQEVTVPDGIDLRLLPAGHQRAAPKDFFSADNTRAFFEPVKEGVDYVVVDGLPILQVAHMARLLSYADAAIVVVPHNSSVANQEEVADRLSLIGTPLLGYVYNRAPLRPELTYYTDAERPKPMRMAHQRPTRAKSAPVLTPSADRGQTAVGTVEADQGEHRPVAGGDHVGTAAPGGGVVKSTPRGEEMLVTTLPGQREPKRPPRDDATQEAGVSASSPAEVATQPSARDQETVAAGPVDDDEITPGARDDDVGTSPPTPSALSRARRVVQDILSPEDRS